MLPSAISDLCLNAALMETVSSGIDVPKEETAELEAHLADLGYPHWEESDNPAYAIFLS